MLKLFLTCVFAAHAQARRLGLIQIQHVLEGIFRGFLHS